MARREPLNERTLAAFLCGDIDVAVLSREVSSATEQVNATQTNVHVRNMSEPFIVSSAMLIRLCDAALALHISPTALRSIAFAIIVSESFEWAEDLVGEVLHDWSAPEVNYELNEANLRQFRSWLAYEQPYSQIKNSDLSIYANGPIVSETRKIPHK